MRLRLVACEVLAREVFACAAEAQAVVDVTLLTQGLHDLGPAPMRERLQGEIDATDPSRYDAVALGYALCSNGVDGLRARALPVVIPRAHDCITLLLGSRERYSAEFETHPGTYYMSVGWHERDRENLGPAEPGIARRLGMDRTEEEYAALYGEENARYIVEQLRGGLRHYDRLVFVENGLGGEAAAREEARSRAAREGWRFEVVRGDLRLIRKLAARDWDDEFVVLRPGEVLRASHDDRILEGCACRSD